MTSMLYSDDMIKSTFPEAVQPGRHYRFRDDLKLNAWAFVAVVLAIVSRSVLKQYQDWGVPVRAMVALAPLAPSLMYVRSIGRWIRGMDELQRRIQLEACLFSTTATVFITTGLSLISGAGRLDLSRVGQGLGWEGTFTVIFIFYVLGNTIFNRRYR